MGFRDRSQALGLFRLSWAPLASPGSKEVSGDTLALYSPYPVLVPPYKPYISLM